MAPRFEPAARGALPWAVAAHTTHLLTKPHPPLVHPPPLPQCIDARGNMVALWETSQLADPFSAKLTLKPAALPIVTEIVTTLILNRIAQVSNWTT